MQVLTWVWMCLKETAEHSMMAECTAVALGLRDIHLNHAFGGRCYLNGSCLLWTWGLDEHPSLGANCQQAALTQS